MGGWERTRILGHRGRGRTEPGNPWPENTLLSFEAAIREGADMLELDVRLSADGQAVVIHDETLDRTTDGSGLVGTHTLASLRARDAGARVRPGQGVGIPSLSEVLEAVPVDLNVELKTEGGEAGRRALAEVTAHALASDPQKKREIIVSSFDARVLAAVGEVLPEARLGLLTESEANVRVALSKGTFTSVHLADRIASPALLRSVRNAGLLPLVWTVNDGARARDLSEHGALGIITDRPGLIRAALGAASGTIPTPR